MAVTLITCLAGTPSNAHERFQPAREIRDAATECREHRNGPERIAIRLRDASTIRGMLIECKSDRFEIAAEPTNRVRMVRYADVSAFLDPDTGAVVATVAMPPPSRLNRDGKVLVGIGIGLAVFYLWAYLSGAFANP